MFRMYRFPLVGFDDLRLQMGRLFDQFSPRGVRTLLHNAGVNPALNVWDADDALHVEAEVPGIKQDDLEVFALGNELTIKGRRAPLEGENRTYHCRERGTGEFTRVLTLPVDVDANQIEATLKDGVLSLRLPKSERAKPRKIPLKTE